MWMSNLFTIFIGEKSGLCLNILADSTRVAQVCSETSAVKQEVLLILKF